MHYYSEHPTSPLGLGLLRCRLRGLNFEFLTASGVFSRKRLDKGTRLLIESMILPKTGSALDLGCGFGPIGIAAAKLNPLLRVWMTDVNERALMLAKENVRRNLVDNAQIIGGSLYEPICDVSFDVILTNPPISAGIKKVVEPIIEGAPMHLKPEGSLQLVVQSTKGGRIIENLMQRYFGGFEVIARKSGYRVLRTIRS